MDIEQVMRDYNHFERVWMQDYVPGERVNGRYLVKHVAHNNDGSMICFFDLAGEDPESIIQAEVDFFSARGKSFEWKVYGTDKPQDIGELLKQMGFSEGEREAFMILDLHAETLPLTSGNSCIKVTDAAGIHDMILVQQEVWGQGFTDFERTLVDELESNPQAQSIYVGYDGQVPVASSRISFNGQSPFAGLWSGSTLASHRGRGFYTDMLLARAGEALRRGIRYLTIDASDMSRPIVEKYGFQHLTYTIPYVYSPT